MKRSSVAVTPRSVAAALVAGAVLGTGLDRLHVEGGALSYNGPGQPWWVPVEFAIFGLVALLAIARLGDPVPDESSPRRALAEIALFAALYGATALWWRRPDILAVAFVVVLAFRVPALQRDGGANAIPAAALVVGGPAVEALISGAGLFSYAREDFLGLPLWLPLLYMLAVPLVVRGAEALLWIGRRRAVASEDAAPTA